MVNYQCLPPAQKPVATPSTPKSPNRVSPSNSVPYIVRRAGGTGVPSSVAAVRNTVSPKPEATSLLDGCLCIPPAHIEGFMPLSCPPVGPPDLLLPVVPELPRRCPKIPSCSDWRLRGRSMLFAGDGDVGGSGCGKVPIAEGKAKRAGVDVGRQPKRKTSGGAPTVVGTLINGGEGGAKKSRRLSVGGGIST